MGQNPGVWGMRKGSWVEGCSALGVGRVARGGPVLCCTGFACTAAFLAPACSLLWLPQLLLSCFLQAAVDFPLPFPCALSRLQWGLRQSGTH